MVDALHLTRKLFRQSSLASFVARETRPGIDMQDDRQLLDYIKRSGQTSWHPIGTCKMGDDAMAVVDSQLRVSGVDHLRMIGSSIMRTMCSPNTNAASVMIGEKGADMVLADRKQAMR